MITKADKIENSIKEYVLNGEWNRFFEQYVVTAPDRRLRLLWEIAVETDLDNYGLLEEKVYAYGSCLSAKDQLGRLLFSRMVLLLRKIK